MIRFLCACSLVLALFQSVRAEFTVHVQNPFRADTCAFHRDSLMMSGNNETGYYSNKTITSEGGDWFYYTYEFRNNNFTLVTWCGATYNRTDYKFSLNVDSLFNLFPAGTNEIWVSIADQNSKGVTTNTPPNGKVIYLFNPWPDNSPQMIIGNKKVPLKMRPRVGLCGWYTGYYAGPSDSLWNVQFTDYYKTQRYTASGLTAGTGIDFTPIVKTNDTIYVLPKPFPYGVPSLSAKFPGRTGDCGTRKVSGKFRDWAIDPYSTNASFFNSPMGMTGGGHKNMVEKTLVAPDYVPVKTKDPSVNVQYLGHLETWYKTITFPNGLTNDTCIDLMLKKGEDGRWEYNSDWTNGFFPLDSFRDSIRNPNNIKYYDRVNASEAGGHYHNFHFTMEMHLQFVYHKAGNKGNSLEFDFQGDDDLWIFINNKLAIDLGGLNYIAKDTLLLDYRPDLGLVDGTTYSMDIFFAERNPVASNFKIKTSMDLHNTDELYYKENVIANGQVRYDIWQRITTPGLGCGQNLILNEEGPATVDFFIDGPQIDGSKALPVGTSYGGVTVDPTKTKVLLDSAKITDLVPGEYHITFVSTIDKNRTGYLTFIVPPIPPDHVDALTDSTALDPMKDNDADSMFISLLQPSRQIHAILRDKYQSYVQDATNPVWVSRDPTVATVASSPNKSWGTVTKVSTGTTWIVVNEGTLRADSIKVTTLALPQYPVIASAVMIDNNADLIPDLVTITLTDTFHTGQTLDSIVIAYQGTFYGVSGAGATISNKTVSVPFSNATAIDGRPTDKVIIMIAVDNGVKSDTGTYTDGVRPGLTAASVLENDGAGPDIMYLTFSEPVDSASLKGKQLLLVKTGGTDTISLTIEAIMVNQGDLQYTVRVNSSGLQPKLGDALRLLPQSKNGTITDKNKNKPHDLNHSVILGQKPGPVSIISSYYTDNNADGVVDNLTLVFKRKIVLTDIASIKIQWNGLGDTILLDRVVAVNDSTFSLSVPGRKSVIDSKIIRTTGVLIDTVVFKEFLTYPRVSIADDSAAPVIVSAKILPGSLKANGASRDNDTLIVKFSEEMLAIGSSPFSLLSRTTKEKYGFTVSPIGTQSNDSYRFVITATNNPAVPLPGNGDTIWIDAGAGVSDKYKVVQDNPANRRVALEIIWPPAQWIIKVSRNPFTPMVSPNTIISLTPTTPMDLALTSGQIQIFDAIGNVVVFENIQPKNGGYFYTWDARNKNGRLVGTGTYLCVITIKDTIKSSVKKIRIGVKR